jgi:hypothetical protein
MAAFVCAAVVWMLGDPNSYADKTDWYVLNAMQFYAIDMGILEVIKNIIPVILCGSEKVSRF